jgi:hypothetical protein
MTESYLQDLDDALKRNGFQSRRRARIVTEFADHLHEDPTADLGPPDELAGRFADELGTSYARTAATTAFAALALAGILVAVRAVALLPFRSADFGAADTIGLLVAVLSGQIAFAAGTLGLIRAVRHRARATIPAREAVVLARRAGVGLVAGTLTLLAFPITQSYRAHPGAITIGHGSSGGWLWAAASIAGLIALAAAAPAVIRAARVRPRANGPGPGPGPGPGSGTGPGPGTDLDLLADLGPVARIVRSPTRFALLFAGALAVAVTLAGIAGNDPYDGAARGIVEGGACLGGYLTLGRYLGLK